MDSIDRCPYINTSIGSSNLCTSRIEYAFYNYNVSVWQAGLFVGLFSALTIAHLVQAFLAKRWWLYTTFTLCAALETLGWAGRLASARAVEWKDSAGGVWDSPKTPFLMQISVLIFSPAFLAAGYYILLGQLIKRVGPQYCRWNPTLYAVVFCIGDFVSLVVQAVGGGMASAAEGLEAANRGGYVMVGGVFAQMAIMVLYCIVLVDWIVRFYARRPVKLFRFRKAKRAEQPLVVPRDAIAATAQRKLNILVGALATSTIFLFIRSIYRCVELLEGWRGEIISNQKLFTILDGLMVFIAVLFFNIVHPLWCWPAESEVGETYIEKVNSEPLSTA